MDGHLTFEVEDTDGFENIDDSDWGEDSFVSDEAAPRRGERRGMRFTGKGFSPRTSKFVGSGVRNATLNTPRGKATLELAKPAVPLEVFQRHAEETATNFRNTSASLAVARKAIEKESEVRAADINRLTVEIAKLKKDGAGGSSFSTLLPLLMHQQLDQKINSLHPGTTSSSSQSMLPMMMLMTGMGGNGGGDNNMMTMMMVMMMMGQNQHSTTPSATVVV